LSGGGGGGGAGEGAAAAAVLRSVGLDSTTAALVAGSGLFARGV
jgi:hypothetical protein